MRWKPAKRRSSRTIGKPGSRWSRAASRRGATGSTRARGGVTQAEDGQRVADVWPDLEAEDDDEEEGEDEPASEAVRATEPSADEVGRVIMGRWRIVRQLGVGGFGTAWEAVDVRLPGSPAVVLKQARTPEERTRLRDEYLLAQQLLHQNICAYNSLEEDPGFGAFLVLRHAGESLERVLARSGRWAPKKAVGLCREVAAGLDHAHSREILHLDVKPANILIDSMDGRHDVRVGDWGVSVRARPVQRQRGATIAVGQLLGYSPLYAAPEQHRGEEGRRASDQFALARVYCALVAGREPTSPTDLAVGGLGLRGPAVTVLEQALHPEVDRRFPSCGAFVNALSEVVSSPLEGAVRDLIERLGIERGRAESVARTHRLGGLATVGALLERTLRAALVEASDELGTTPEALLGAGRDPSPLERASVGQLTTALSRVPRSRVREGTLLRRLLEDLKGRDSVLKRAVEVRNRVAHDGVAPAGADEATDELWELLASDP